MKYARIENGVIIEIIPSEATVPSVAHWYGEDFAAKCKEVPDEVLPNWVYLSDTNTFIAKIEDINTIRNKKIEELRFSCNSSILGGFDSNCLGETKHFDSEYTDQSTIQGLVVTAMLISQGLTTETLKWKATGELECYEWTPQQILTLGIDMKKHIEKNINIFNTLRIAVNTATTVEEVEAISW